MVTTLIDSALCPLASCLSAGTDKNETAATLRKTDIPDTLTRLPEDRRMAPILKYLCSYLKFEETEKVEPLSDSDVSTSCVAEGAK